MEVGYSSNTCMTKNIIVRLQPGTIKQFPTVVNRLGNNCHINPFLYLDFLKESLTVEKKNNKIQISWKKKKKEQQKEIKLWKRRARNLLMSWQAAGSTSAGEYATLIFIMEWSQMDCFRIPSVLTEALDQQAACLSLSFTFIRDFQLNSHFGKGRFCSMECWCRTFFSFFPPPFCSCVVSMLSFCISLR